MKTNKSILERYLQRKNSKNHGLYSVEIEGLNVAQCLCTKYQSKNHIIRNNAILDYCDRVVYNLIKVFGK